jgi:hypothetical protein
MTSFRGQKGLDRDTVFWAKVDRKESNECWNYLGYLDKDGYGNFWDGYTTVRAHRYAWEISRKTTVPDGKLILHLCDNRRCCNPMHIYCGDNSDNMCDRSKNPQYNPTSHAHPRYTEGEIWLIRKLRVVTNDNPIKKKYKFSSILVAKMFGTHNANILRIWNSDKYLSKEGTYV